MTVEITLQAWIASFKRNSWQSVQPHSVDKGTASRDALGGLRPQETAVLKAAHQGRAQALSLLIPPTPSAAGGASTSPGSPVPTLVTDTAELATVGGSGCGVEPTLSVLRFRHREPLSPRETFGGCGELGSSKRPRHRLGLAVPTFWLAPTWRGSLFCQVSCRFLASSAFAWPACVLSEPVAASLLGGGVTALIRPRIALCSSEAAAWVL